jgi:hypothetical protein
MATLQTKWPTLLDVVRAQDPDGGIAALGEVLNETNEILDVMTWKEGNLATGHRGAIRTGLPTPTWRKLYGGVQPTKSTRATVTDTCGMLEDYAEVDKALADLNGNTSAFRLSEDRAHIEGISQALATTLIYGDADTTPEKFTGLAARFDSLSAENADNIVSGGGGDSDNTSIYLVVFGDDVHGIYPKGSTAGLTMEDKGQVTIENVDGSNGRMEAYRTHYKWDCGLHVKDWRQIVRIANIKTASLTKNAASGADLIDLMTQALEIVHNINGGRAAFICNRTVRSYLRRQITNKVASSTLSMEEVAGRRVVIFEEVPVYRTDAILNTEDAVA